MTSNPSPTTILNLGNKINPIEKVVFFSVGRRVRTFDKVREQCNNTSLKPTNFKEKSGSRVPGRGHRIMAITSAFQADDVGSIPTARSKIRCADIAQLVERTLGKGEVGSSNLPISTTS